MPENRTLVGFPSYLFLIICGTPHFGLVFVGQSCIRSVTFYGKTDRSYGRSDVYDFEERNVENENKEGIN